MKHRAKLIENGNEFLFVNEDLINVGESFLKINENGEIIKESFTADSIMENDGSAYRIIAKTSKVGWITTGDSTIKKFIRAELRPAIINSIIENDGHCEIETYIETKTFGTNEADFYESDSIVPFLINDLPVIHI